MYTNKRDFYYIKVSDMSILHPFAAGTAVNG